MKTETIEEFKKRGGRIKQLSKIESSPGRPEVRLKTKLADNWPTKVVVKKKEQTT